MADFKTKQSDKKVEMSVLNLMLFHEDAIDIAIENEIDVDDFSNELHQWMFKIILEIYVDDEYGGVAIGSDMGILLERMRETVSADDKTILATVNGVKTTKAELKLLNLYLTELRKYTKIRKVIEALRRPMRYLQDNADNLDAEKLVSIYSDAYQDVFSDVVSNIKAVTTRDLTEKVIMDVLDEHESPSVVQFGLSGLDDYCKLLNGYLTYIAGDSGVGKTTVATHLAAAIAERGTKVLFVGLETNSEDCMKKLISARVEVNGRHIMYSHLINPALLTRGDGEVLMELSMRDVLEDLGIYWIFNPGMTVEELRREITRYVRMYDIGVVIGDYYQLLQLDGLEGEHDSVIVPRVSKALMSIAGQSYLNPEGKRKKLVHIWLAQINKDVQYRGDKHPTKDDLYYGGVRDARLVLGIYRDEYYNEETERPGIIELGILKQNNGIAGNWFDYIFDAQFQSIRDMTDEERESLNGDEEYEDSDDYE